MSDKTNEKLSAFLDGELDGQHLAELKSQLNDDALRKRLNRYAFIGESLKGNQCSFNAQSVADKVHQALENEPTVFAPKSVSGAARKAGSWKTYVAGGAIAAAVASVAIFNIGVLTPVPQGQEQFPVTVQVEKSVPRPFMNGYAQPASTHWETARAETPAPEVETELNQFLIEHSEYTTQSGMPGLVPYATFVVYDKK